MEENLQEMIRNDNDEMYHYSNNTQPIEDIEKDDGILTIDIPTVGAETTINEEEPVSEQDNEKKTETGIVLVPEYSDVMNMEYEPDTEEELIDLTKALNARMDYWQIGTYWMIGRNINSYYQRKGNYGKGTLEKISLEIGIGLDTLRKAKKFAKVYNEEQLKILLNGTFLLKWNNIAQNLTVDPEIFVEVFKETNNSNEFNRNIIDCKKSLKSEVSAPGTGTVQNEVSEIEESSTSEIATEAASSEIATEAASSEMVAEEASSSEIASSEMVTEAASNEIATDAEGEHILNEYDAPIEPEPENIGEIENAEVRTVVENSDEIAELNNMLDDSRAELIKRDKEKQDNERVFNEMNKEIEVLNDLLEDFKTELAEKDSQIERLNETILEMQSDQGSENWDETVEQMKVENEKKDGKIEQAKKQLKLLEDMVNNGEEKRRLLGCIGGMEIDLNW